MSARERIKAGFEAVGMSGARAEKMYSDLVSALKEEIPEWTFSAEIRQPELIQGYTAEQWQEIIDGGYLCEFAFGENFSYGATGVLHEIGYDADEKQTYFCHTKEEANQFSHCRPAQIKGVMRPIFVEPVGKEADCVFFNDCDSFAGGSGGLRNEYRSWDEIIEDNPIGFATKYIEV